MAEFLSHPTVRMEVPPRSVNCRGLGRFLARGTDMAKRIRGEDVLTRFYRHVVVEGDCHIFTGTPSQRYPSFAVGSPRKHVRVHRWAYEQFVGPIPDGFAVHHTCGQTRCVNPDHLELLTPSDHAKHHNPRWTHCANGHEFTPETTYEYTYNGKVFRACAICRKERVKFRDPEKVRAAKRRYNERLKEARRAGKG